MRSSNRITKSVVLVIALLQLLSINSFCSFASCFVQQPSSSSMMIHRHANSSSNSEPDTTTTTTASPKSTKAEAEASSNSLELFDEFASFLQTKQTEIIDEIEQLEREYVDNGSDDIKSKSKSNTKHATFSRDCWGAFLNDNDDSGSKNNNGSGSGGITRVIQKGSIIEKGACSFTLLKNGKLTKDRAASIRGRQDDTSINIKEGDNFCAAALSMVLHTRSPMVPTFRSDVRIFLVESSDDNDNGEMKTVAWFGGGSDLTPYYLFDDDITFFHKQLRDLCDKHKSDDDTDIDYPTMKQACDEYFYLPARSEHRGVGGMFFDDMPATPKTMDFVRDVTSNWMPSWFPLIRKRQNLEYTEKQREWQLLRRGRYLEFNLLYDRGVKFGLANANPRVEGVMVSAPPLIAWEYNHEIEANSEEDRLMQILKAPIEWV